MQYKYVGDGLGVPGLPHEISDEEAQEQGVSELLHAAIENGSYVEVSSIFQTGLDMAVSTQPTRPPKKNKE